MPWRAKKFCSERCAATARKRAQRGPCHGMKQPPATMVADGESDAPQSLDFVSRKKSMSRDETPLEWRECNEVTWMLIPEQLHPPKEASNATAWAMKAGDGWYGRIGKDFSFGPASLARAKQAVEARLNGPRLRSARARSHGPVHAGMSPIRQAQPSSPLRRPGRSRHPPSKRNGSTVKAFTGLSRAN